MLQWHVTRVDLQYLVSSLLVRDPDLDLSVEPARSSESGVYCVGSVGSCYYYDFAPCFETIHQGEQLADNSPLDFSSYLLALWSYRVNLIDEYDGRCFLLRLLEYLSESCLRFTVEFAHDLRTTYRN